MNQTKFVRNVAGIACASLCLLMAAVAAPTQDNDGTIAGGGTYQGDNGGTVSPFPAPSSDGTQPFPSAPSNSTQPFPTSDNGGANTFPVQYNSDSPRYSTSGGPALVSSRSITTGTEIKATLLDGLDSSTAQVGTTVRAQVASGDASGLPAGTVFVGRVTRIHPATAKYPGAIDVSFGVAGRTRDGQNTGPVSFRDAASAHLVGKTASGDKSNYTSIGAGAGALIGLSRKGKLGDAVTGALLGGAGGYAANQAQKHAAGDVSMKSGSAITIKMNAPLTLRTEIVAPY